MNLYVCCPILGIPKIRDRRLSYENRWGRHRSAPAIRSTCYFSGVILRCLRGGRDFARDDLCR